MDDDTFDDINEESFIDDNDEVYNDNGHVHQNAWEDMLAQPGPAGGGGAVPANQQARNGGGGHDPMVPSQDHDFQSQVHVQMRTRVGPERTLVPEPRPQNVETELYRKVDKPAYRKWLSKMPRVQPYDISEGYS
ncbi:hypothetical protein BGX24_000213 [Mortierella sp. AD032]|nr:hypothetical protein BGX24_000213 [Mortierella sp. AD032]